MMSAVTSPFEVAAALANPFATPLQRGDGAVELVFSRRGAATGVARLYHRAPCRVQFPHAPAHEPTLAILLNTAGGLTGGDRISVTVSAEAAASATVSTAAAEKLYRSLGPDCVVAVDLAVGDGAWLEWLPQETILFDGARLRRSLSVRVAATGRLLAAEMLVFGRVARGERWTNGTLRDKWRIERARKLAWYDSIFLGGDAIAHPAGIGAADALATAAYIGADASRHLPLARDLTDDLPCRAGATLVNAILVARFLGSAVAVRNSLAQYVGGLRHGAGGLPTQPPRVWKI
jgi:urease accessory protein